MQIYMQCFFFWTAGKAFVEATKNKTEEELDEDVRMETENIQVQKCWIDMWTLTLLPLRAFFNSQIFMSCLLSQREHLEVSQMFS